MGPAGRGVLQAEGNTSAKAMSHCLHSVVTEQQQKHQAAARNADSWPHPRPPASQFLEARPRALFWQMLQGILTQLQVWDPVRQNLGLPGPPSLSLRLSPCSLSSSTLGGCSSLGHWPGCFLALTVPPRPPLLPCFLALSALCSGITFSLRLPQTTLTWAPSIPWHPHPLSPAWFSQWHGALTNLAFVIDLAQV